MTPLRKRKSEVAMIALVKEAMDRLPERYRLPVWLHHYERLAFREVAAATRKATPEPVFSFAMRSGL